MGKLLPSHLWPAISSVPPSPTTLHLRRPEAVLLLNHLSTVPFTWTRRCLCLEPLPPLLGAANATDPASTRMQKDKPLIGLSWKPKINIPSAQISSSKKSEAPQKSLWLPESKLVDGLFVPPSDPKKVNKLIRKSRKDTAGTHWFDMPAPTITSEIQKDLEIIKLRGTIDPKRHYKKAGSRKKDLPKYFQMGTVIESSTDYYSGRLTKQERKATIADELLSDEKFNSYRKRKVREIGEARRPGGKEKWKIRGKAKKPPSKKKKAIL